jgi:hypothetical protein
MPAKSCPCPPQIADLIEHLKASGTGFGKLEALKCLAAKCKGSEEFLVEAAKIVPEGTMAKITAFVASHKPVVADEPMLKAPTPETVEAESEVAKFNAQDAISHIANMRSIEKLEHIILVDPRVTVQRAATERLEALNKPAE